MRQFLAIIVVLVILAVLLGYGLVRRALGPDRPPTQTVPNNPQPSESGRGESPATGESALTSIRFREVAQSAGIEIAPFHAAFGRFRLIETMGSGVGLIDFDSDGWLDIVIGQGAAIHDQMGQSAQPTSLYRNNRDGTFTNATDSANFHVDGFTQGMAVGDIDADGHDDLFIAGFGRSSLFRNTGQGGLEDITERAGLAGSGWPTSCAFADLDADGDLDLYVCHYLADTVDAQGNPTVRCDALEGKAGYCPPQAHLPEADVLFRNNGDGTFTDVSAEAGLADHPAPGLGLAIADLDGDGRLDIFVANDQMPNQAWRNLGGLRFSESAHEWGLALAETGEARAGMGVAAGDTNDDGRLDLLVTNFYEEPNSLFRQLAPGLFQVATPDSRLAVPSRAALGFGVGFLDADSDGRLDLFVTNGHLNDVRPLGIPYAQRPQFFHNTGGGRFAEISTQAADYFQGEYLGRAVALGDLDNDGDTDLVVTHLDRPPALLLNETPRTGGVLSLSLNSVSPSGSAVGARVTVHIGDRSITREVVGGTSYLASHDRRLLIGLGDAQKPDRLEVRWPSGTLESWDALPEAAFLKLDEGKPPAAHAGQNPPLPPETR